MSGRCRYMQVCGPDSVALVTALLDDVMHTTKTLKDAKASSMHVCICACMLSGSLHRPALPSWRVSAVCG